METCNNNNGIAPGVKIFGAIFQNNELVGDPIPMKAMKKSASMGNLSSQNFINNDNEVAAAGYVSDGIGKATHERKKDEIPAPKDSLVSNTKKSDAEKSLQASSSSQALALVNVKENLPQTGNLGKDIPPLAQIRPPEYGAPNYHPLPFTVGIPGSTLFIPMGIPVIFHPSNIPSALPLPQIRLSLPALGANLSSSLRHLDPLN
ncbi:probable transcription factor At5g61620 [Fagus crenata]